RSVPAGEIEAARAYGFSSVKLYRCIILPSALRIALPAYSNEVILMLHSTALAPAIRRASLMNPPISSKPPKISSAAPP
ncbi:hypothetical protein NL372_30955, partial [Klebsiella pneumoniae]|nr:hypothetical protein [Klebsiella pneumoniae]